MEKNRLSHHHYYIPVLINYIIIIIPPIIIFFFIHHYHFLPESDKAVLHFLRTKQAEAAKRAPERSSCLGSSIVEQIYF